MIYPEPQYADPIFMNSNDYRAVPLDGAPGVAEKALGTFTDCKIRCARYTIEPGATLDATGRGVYLTLAGAGSVAGAPLRAFTGVYLESGERAAFTATETADVLLMGLPDIARMKTWLPHLDARETAKR
jgi:hypothetical protein